ncbi:MAG TPA: response regulator [Microvirga sp.]|nr:response regulator [Microvirga sp.]
MALAHITLHYATDTTGSGSGQPQAAPRPTVLVVEDEVLVRMMLADVLDDAGFRVIEAANADEALRVLAAIPEIAAVVTDVEMPGGSLNGFELARRVRDEWRIGVLIASGRQAPRQGELPDGSHFIAKPVYPETLVSLIRSLLQD